MDQSNPDLLYEFEQRMDLVPVSPLLRFVNAIIDTFVYYIAALALGFLIGIMLVTQGATLSADPEPETQGATTQLLLFLLGAALVVAYYTLFEGATKGRTLGKMATGTIVVKEDGSPITYKDALLRSLIRCVPFEFLTALTGRPWHDRWTNTIVIKKPN